ncbi:MAG: hypothetical protein COB13_012695 [OCS116 cluster bacterium]|uniref:Uncharacterized protein n=1 Tax=OCS116 cluster bacterium TaxID=2030921 RepID=A0A2A4Z328_9PROT|nr:hypothetical protein [OCS116 cluster bacterium]
MTFLKVVPKFFDNDKKLIFRDSFMVLMLLFTILIAVAVRYILPWLDGILIEKGYMPSENIAYALHDTYPMWASFISLYNGGLLAGMVAGFLMLDEKDEGTLTALIVTPVPLQHYTFYRFGLAALFSFLMMMIMVYIVGIELLPFWQLTLLCASASLVSIIVSLFLSLAAQNKIQGFAMGKFTSIAGWVIMGGWFLPENWQWLLGIFPPFLVHKAYWLALDGNPLWWLALALGTLLQVAAIYWMSKKFNESVYK